MANDGITNNFVFCTHIIKLFFQIRPLFYPIFIFILDRGTFCLKFQTVPHAAGHRTHRPQRDQPQQFGWSAVCLQLKLYNSRLWGIICCGVLVVVYIQVYHLVPDASAGKQQPSPVGVVY